MRGTEVVENRGAVLGCLIPRLFKVIGPTGRGVGDDKSRTWVFTLNDAKLIQLKHDHRHTDGSEDKITQYGGTSANTGLDSIQFFPADQYTSNLIPYASNNVWWITLDATSFTYNLRRIGTDRLFSVKFDTTNQIETPSAPWGSED